MTSILPLLAALIGGGGIGGFAAWIRVRSQNRLDEATAQKTQAETGAIELTSARELIAELRAELNRRVGALEKEVAYVHGKLDSTRAERDRYAAEVTRLTALVCPDPTAHR